MPRVVVEGLPHAHQGRRFSLSIEAVPTGGAPIRISEEGPQSSRSEPYTVVHAGFRRLRQHLESANASAAARRRRRPKSKTA